MSIQTPSNSFARSSSGSAGPLELSHHKSLKWSQQSSNNLRHRTEYERIRTLGSGAFGTTHLVKSLIDKHLYALKCIRLGRKLSESSNKVLREVDALSALRSDNVVRYYTAWVERGEIEHDSLDELDDYSSFTNGSVNTDNGQETCNLCNKQYKDWIISYEQWGLIDAVLQPLNLCRHCYINSLPSDIDASSIDIRERTILPECLYILMEYGGDTLTDVMTKIPKNDDATRWALFVQCVQGLYSIHNQGFYHRDIKPGNIFVQDGLAKIGDLGLSTDYRVEQSCLNAGSSGVGTYLYSAPEVEEGVYQKADIYSLGVVLIELFSNFSTGMERANILSRIRQGDIPNDWTGDTDHAVLARMMVDRNPEKRPTARELLQLLVQRGRLTDPDSTVLLNVIEQLQSNIDRLEKTLQRKDGEVQMLRKLLSDNGISIPS
jgi:serine/threonine protein kinase